MFGLFVRSPVVGFGRNLVEIHRSAPPQLSNRFLGGNFDEKSQKIGGENPPKSTRKSFIRIPLYFNNRGGLLTGANGYARSQL